MSKCLYLIRHGESQGNLEGRIQGWVDYPLSEPGRQQAARLAERLAQPIVPGWREGSIYQLVASPLRRAAETAQIIGQALALPVRSDERLKEYNFGPLAGLTSDEIVASFPSVRADWEAKRLWQPLPGEEGEAAFVARVRQAMDEVVAGMAEGAGLAVVAHGGSLDACLRSWLGLANPGGASEDGRGQRRIFAFDNTSLSLVRIQPEGYRILVLNDTCHLRHDEEGGEQ